MDQNAGDPEVGIRASGVRPALRHLGVVGPTNPDLTTWSLGYNLVEWVYNLRALCEVVLTPICPLNLQFRISPRFLTFKNL